MAAGSSLRAAFLLPGVGSLRAVFLLFGLDSLRAAFLFGVAIGKRKRSSVRYALGQPKLAAVEQQGTAGGDVVRPPEAGSQHQQHRQDRREAGGELQRAQRGETADASVAGPLHDQPQDERRTGDQEDEDGHGSMSTPPRYSAPGFAALLQARGALLGEPGTMAQIPGRSRQHDEDGDQGERDPSDGMLDR